MSKKIYSVPENIVSGLGLKKYRKGDGSGHYLLSALDLRCYGIDKALEDGAEELTAEQAKEKFNL